MPLFQSPSGEYFCELASETCRSIGELTCNDQRQFLAVFCRQARQPQRRPPPSQTPGMSLFRAPKTARPMRNKNACRTFSVSR